MTLSVDSAGSQVWRGSSLCYSTRVSRPRQADRSAPCYLLTHLHLDGVDPVIAALGVSRRLHLAAPRNDAGSAAGYR